MTHARVFPGGYDGNKKNKEGLFVLDLSVYPAIDWPRFLRVRQTLGGPPEIQDVEGAVEAAVASQSHRIEAGKTYAVGVGSRGIARLADIVEALIRALKRRGADAFIFPAMGSHGGATAEGQRDVLETLGVTEARMGVPIRARMDVKPLAEVEPGLWAYASVDALEADGIILVARVKPHTAFHGPIESGVCKMLAIGLGKQRGAASVHAVGFARFAEVIPKVARTVLDHIRMPFSLAIVENGHDRPALIEALTPEGLESREAALLEKARAWMARLPFDQIDVLVVGEIGKNISGDGADPNVTGRYAPKGVSGGPDVQKLVYLNLTLETHGNGMGVGMADIVTEHLYRQLDLAKTYTNAFTSTEMVPAKIPVVMPSDHDAIELALRTLNGRRPEAARVVAIPNTLKLEEMVISEPLWQEAEAKGCVRLSEPAPARFDERGNAPVLAGLRLYADR
jgi:hypothetical protein